MKTLHMVMLLSFLLLFSACPLCAASQELTFLVIVHADNPETALSSKDIAKLFLKKVKIWEQTNAQVLPVDQLETAAIREEFSQAILEKPQAAIKAYWQKQIFSGRDVPPLEKDSDEEVLKYVAANPGAIGYISASTDLGDYQVSVVEIGE